MKYGGGGARRTCVHPGSLMFAYARKINLMADIVVRAGPSQFARNRAYC